MGRRSLKFWKSTTTSKRAKLSGSKDGISGTAVVETGSLSSSEAIEELALASVALYQEYHSREIKGNQPSDGEIQITVYLQAHV